MYHTQLCLAFFQVPSLDVAVPMHLKGQRARHNSLTEESESLNFVVMLKKGNKQQLKGEDVKSSCYEFVTLVTTSSSLHLACTGSRDIWNAFIECIGSLGYCCSFNNMRTVNFNPNLPFACFTAVNHIYSE